MKITKFEDIEAWKEARLLVQSIHKLKENEDYRKDFELRNQIERAGVSVMANIAEGFDCASNKEFLQFLSYSRRSASEVQSHLYVVLDRKYTEIESFHEIYIHTQKIKKLIGGFVRYLKLSPRKS